MCGWLFASSPKPVVIKLTSESFGIWQTGRNGIDSFPALTRDAKWTGKGGIPSRPKTSPCKSQRDVRSLSLSQPPFRLMIDSLRSLAGRSGVILDAFCGVGGNAIQFAFTCERGKS